MEGDVNEMLTKDQEKKSLLLLSDYHDESIISEDGELDDSRSEQILELKLNLDEFLRNAKSLENFKTKNDSINKRGNNWGFSGFSGQMFFNMLYNFSKSAGKLDDLNEKLHETLPPPANIAEVKQKLRNFEKFVNELKEIWVDGKKFHPNSRSFIYFLTYFWQIFSPTTIPVFYVASMRTPMISLGLLEASNNLEEEYEDFYNLNFDLLNLYQSEVRDNKVNLWFVEHVFWNYYISQQSSEEDNPLAGIEENLEVHESDLKAQVLDRVKQLSDKQFEHLCVKLLQKMGYGFFSAESGEVTGRSGDSGIDGIIKEDKLGFENVYIQAKKWEGTVPSSKVREFAGSVLGRGGKKGVMITTSKFSTDSITWVDSLRDIKIILIDGKLLSEYLVDYNVGVKTKAIETKEIDDEFLTSLSSRSNL